MQQLCSRKMYIGCTTIKASVTFAATFDVALFLLFMYLHRFSTMRLLIQASLGTTASYSIELR